MSRNSNIVQLGQPILRRKAQSDYLLGDIFGNVLAVPAFCITHRITFTLPSVNFTVLNLGGHNRALI